MSKLIMLSAAGAAFAVLTAAAPVAAQTRSGEVSIQGSNGRGVVLERQIQREPGSVSVDRSATFNNGRSVSMERGASWGDGSYQGATTRTLGDGRTFGRTSGLTRNGDGSANYVVGRNRIDGSSRTYTGQIRRRPR